MAAFILCFFHVLSISLASTLPSAGVITGKLFTDEKLTIRVNTFKRPDLLKYFLTYYQNCPIISEVQVIWSDISSKPPKSEAWITDIKKKIVFEEHQENTLSNRFFPMLPIETDAVLTIDDDIIITCEDLSFLLHTWTANRDALVGISPRLHSYDVISGKARYLNWQYAWWNGMYSIVLTKANILHKKYVQAYGNEIPQVIQDYIKANRNCEDIAIAYLSTKHTNAAPVWSSVLFYDIAGSGISSGAGHFQKRSECLQLLETSVNPSATTLLEPASPTSSSLTVSESASPNTVTETVTSKVRSEVSIEEKRLKANSRFFHWVVGYQKVVPLAWWNTYSLYFDRK